MPALNGLMSKEMDLNVESPLFDTRTPFSRDSEPTGNNLTVKFVVLETLLIDLQKTINLTVACCSATTVI